MVLATRGPVQTLSLHFQKFIANIRPSEKRLDAAQHYPKLVRDFLEETGLLDTEEPHTRLTGSYDRQIAVHDIKDVDFVVCLNQKYRDLGPLKALEDLRDALDALADDLEEELGERPEVKLREQRRSVRVHFLKDDFFLDVVPIVIREEDERGVEGTLDVPDREWVNWQPTACVGYGTEFSKMNGEADGKLIKLMMAVKHWAGFTLKRKQAKSFWVEALVIDLVRKGEITFKSKSMAEYVADTFEAIQERCAPSLAIAGETPVIPDPVIPDLNPNVAFNWERDNFETFMNRVDEAVSRSRKAIDAETADDAIKAWQKVFGDEWFPSSIEEEAKASNRAAFAAATAVTSSGAVIINPAPTVRATPTPAHRFHGDEEAE